jgi:hypothetical protein
MFKYIVIKNKGSTSIADNLLACIKSQYKQSSHHNELLLYFHCKKLLSEINITKLNVAIFLKKEASPM